MSGFFMEQQPDGDILIELRDIYDGWSVRWTEDGRLINRWPKDDRRYQPTQNWIESEAGKHIERT